MHRTTQVPEHRMLYWPQGSGPELRDEDGNPVRDHQGRPLRQINVRERGEIEYHCPTCDQNLGRNAPTAKVHLLKHRPTTTTTSRENR